MNLEKFIGTVPVGEYTVRVTSVEAAKAADNSDKLVFKGTFREADNVETRWQRSLKPTALSMLRDDLEAAEVLRSGEAYPDDPDALASVIYNDLSDRYVTVEVSEGRNGFNNFKIIGTAFAGV